MTALLVTNDFSGGRKIRVNKVPFSSNPKALIKDDARGFVKILSDPATGESLAVRLVPRAGMGE